MGLCHSRSFAWTGCAGGKAHSPSHKSRRQRAAAAAQPEGQQQHPGTHAATPARPSAHARKRKSAASHAASPNPLTTLSPLQVLQLAEEVVDSGRKGLSAEPIQLAAIALVASQGDTSAAPFGKRDSNPVGLCQVRPSVAKFLATSKGYTAHGPRPSRTTLMDPRASLYFCAAHIQELRAHVKAVQSECLMDDGAGTAVKAEKAPWGTADIPDAQSLEECAVRLHFRYASDATDTAGNYTHALESDRSPQSKDQGSGNLPMVHTELHTEADTDGGAEGGCLGVGGKGACMGDVDAGLVGISSARTRARGGTAGGQRVSKQQQRHGQRQQQRQQGGEGGRLGLPSLRGVGEGEAEEQGVMWGKYVHAKEQLQRLSEAVAASKKLDRQSHQMYVVRDGETAASICAALSLSVRDLEDANPEVPLQAEDGGLQANDCIVLPVSVCMPRLYVTKRGDNMYSIASTHSTRATAVRATNADLLGSKGLSTVLEPGWVLSLPGLKGDL